MVSEDTTGMVSWVLLREQAEQAMMIEPINNTHPSPLNHLLPPGSYPV